jgi:hypothetical protein
MQKIQHLSAKKIAFLVLAGFMAMGCERETQDSLDKLVSKTIQVSDAALEQVGSLNSDDAKKEFKKLNQFEYKVLSFKKDVSVKELEGSLTLYGTSGFDCSGPMVREEEFILICKKRPESLLRYIPQTFVGRP